MPTSPETPQAPSRIHISDDEPLLTSALRGGEIFTTADPEHAVPDVRLAEAPISPLDRKRPYELRVGIYDGEDRVGAFNLAQLSEKTWIRDVKIDQERQGERLGLSAYLGVISMAHEAGRRIHSDPAGLSPDKTGTAPARRVWESLVRRGVAEVVPGEQDQHGNPRYISRSPEASREHADAHQELHTKIGEYFDASVTHPYVTASEEATNRMQRHKDAFAGIAMELFGQSLFSERNDHDSNPRLSELADILTSVDHNAGVYYAQDDVQGIFSTVARKVFEDDQQTGHVSSTFHEVNQRASKVTSVDHEQPLSLIKDDDTGWRLAGSEYDAQDDFAPLEVIRQDNADKRGWGKYRFRQPMYTRQPDEVHTKQVEEGWYTSDWYKEPNYWSASIREAMHSSAVDAESQLGALDASVVFVTEGGVFKGTATAETDLDTKCIVTCRSVTDFAEVYDIMDGHIARNMSTVPFKTKRDDMQHAYFDRATGIYYERNQEGVFKVSEATHLKDDLFIDSVRQHEKGLLVTTANTSTLFREPVEYDSKADAYVSINVRTGRVEQTDAPAPKPKPDIARGGTYTDSLDVM
jgi:hypothetical protein